MRGIGVADIISWCGWKSRAPLAAFAAFATEDAVLLPHLREIGAEPLQFRDQGAQRGIVEMRTAMRAKLGGDPASPAFPIADQCPGAGREEDEAQQIALSVFSRRPV